MKQVRMAQLSDASGIAHVHWASWMETYAGLIDPGYLAQRSEEKSRQAFESAGCRDMAVALLDNEIVGFAGFGQAGSEPETGEVRGLYVLRRAQGLGRGRELMQLALDGLREKGCRQAVLWVLATNEKAMGFYEHYGFVFDGTQKEELLGLPVIEKRYRIRL